MQVFRHIFTGPASAISPGKRKGTKPSKGKLHQLTRPTPNTIAYAAVQV
jgi:hypothetical protein